MRSLVVLLIVLIALADLAWNLTHLNIGLVDFFGLSAFAGGAAGGAWPATPYFPAGYPLLLMLGGTLGSTLVMGYILSAGGLALALWALYRLTAELKLDPGVRLACVLLAALMPSYRITAGSPSVDGLYTGLGLWLIAAAISVWIRPGDKALPRWVSLGLIIPALLLPLLRYHSLILILPLLTVLLLARRRQRRIVVIAAAGFCAAFAFNHISAYLAFGKAMPSASALQIRCGIEFDEHVHYESAEALFADYPAFAEQARKSTLLDDYSGEQLARHTLRSWSSYLKRPAVLLALLAALVCLVLRKRFPAGTRIGLVWVLAYTLALSPAYYTPRASLLPELTALALGLVMAQRTVERRVQHLALGAALVLLLAGFLRASEVALQDYRERLKFSELSETVDELVRERGLSSREVASEDWRILPLNGNAWTVPYVTMQRSWIDDPLIRPSQRSAVSYVKPGDAAAGNAAADEIRLLILRRSATGSERISANPQIWKVAELIEGFEIHERR